MNIQFLVARIHLLSLSALMGFALVVGPQALQAEEIGFGQYKGSAAMSYTLRSKDGALLEQRTTRCPLSADIFWSDHRLEVPFLALECGMAWDTGNFPMLDWEIRDGKVFEHGKQIGEQKSENLMVVHQVRSFFVFGEFYQMDLSCQIRGPTKKQIQLGSQWEYQIERLSASAYRIQRILSAERLMTDFELPLRHCGPVQVNHIRNETWALEVTLNSNKE